MSGGRAALEGPMDNAPTTTQDLVPTVCPACGAGAPLRIAYGYPTGDMFEASQRGELALGGCVIGSDSSDLGLPSLRTPLGRSADGDRRPRRPLQRHEGGAR